MRRPLEDLFALLLRHAPEHAKDLVLARALEILEAVEHLLLGFIADAAGVVQHESGVFRRSDLRVALFHERADHLFGIVHVHLAAESTHAVAAWSLPGTRRHLLIVPSSPARVRPVEIRCRTALGRLAAGK